MFNSWTKPFAFRFHDDVFDKGMNPSFLASANGDIVDQTEHFSLCAAITLREGGTTNLSRHNTA